jgi:predicted nuclease of predicted toxin-antitoxin system
VFTHDLDFGTTLALTHAKGPSVLQIRTQDPLPKQWAGTVSAVLRQHEQALADGALVIIEESKARVRVLPL